MPGEAIHLTALLDTASALPSPVARTLSGAGHQSSRIGALLVDLPYFEGFHATFIRFVLGLAPSLSRFGEVLHQRAPITLGRRLAERAALLRRRSETREAGEALAALALGYASHAAVDTALHPLVNRLAAARTKAGSGGAALLAQHQAVEKFQSILYHEERYRGDYLGTLALREYLTVDFSLLVDAGPVRDQILDAMREVCGEAPSPRSLLASARGYQRFVRTITGPLGRRLATTEEKVRERAGLYDAVEFPRRFTEAVARSRRWVEALAAYHDDGVFDDSAVHALSAIMPEQTLDPGPEPA